MKILKWVAVLIGVLLVGGGSAFAWAKFRAGELMARSYTTHTVNFPVPFPLTEAEIAALREERSAALPAAGGTENAVDALEGAVAAPADPLAGVDLDAIALERAVERGRHFMLSRYVCVECHGADLGGGTMIDDPLIGRLLGPNITTGAGGKTANYTVADWDRIVRHGVLPDGRPAAMPAEDFQLMSDQELSDVIAYVRSVPPVDRESTPVSLGPLGTVLMAAGKLPLAADIVRDHQAEHPRLPPPSGPTPEFGRHLAGICTGCHRENFAGGPIPGGPPDWAAAANLTPHESGLAGWTYENFVVAMREAKRPDGTALRPPMDVVAPYAQRMTEVELQAIWSYLQTLTPAPRGS